MSNENVKTLEGQETADALKRIFECFGAPQTIRTDNGTAFKSKQVKALLEAFGTNHRFSIPYSPTSNGKVERQVQTIKSRLSLLLSDVEQKSQWHKFTKAACLSINMAIKPSKPLS